MRTLVLGACAALLLGACSSGSPGPGDQATTSTPDSGLDAEVGADAPDDTGPSVVLPLDPVPSPSEVTPSLTQAALSPTSVLTQHNDVSRSGANLFEHALDTTSVAKGTFGLLFSRDVVGQTYAQPLYVPSLDVPGKGVLDVVLVATEHNDVYLFEADDPALTEPLWHVHLAEPVPTEDLLSFGYCSDLSPEIGITATPVIDPSTGFVYVETKEKTAAGVYRHQLHALDLRTGLERAGSPVEIDGAVPGYGDGTNSEGNIDFSPLREHARSGLLLSHGVIWLAFAGHCDATPFHGWVMAYDAATLRQVGIWNDTADGEDGGIWMGGEGLSAEPSGDVFLVSGNGSFDESSTPMGLGDSFVRLHLGTEGIDVADYFTPYNQDILDVDDLDLGSSGAVLVPGTHLVVGAGKEGRLYVMDRDSMGHHENDGDDQIVQNFQATQLDPKYGHALFGSPVFWNKQLYLWGVADVLRAYPFDGAKFAETPSATGPSTLTPPMPGGILSISADGVKPGTGIVWASHPNTDAGRATSSGVLRAFDAADVSRELWNSNLDPLDDVGTFAKFTPPTVANGHVYLATFGGKLRVYGLK